MKKIICVLMMLLLSLSLVIANVPATTNHISTPISSQEMNFIVGGWSCSGCVDLWIVSFCYHLNPWVFGCE